MTEITVKYNDSNGKPIQLELPMPGDMITAIFEERSDSPSDVICDYSFRLAGLNDRITEPHLITHLNAFAEQLSELSEYERVLLAGAAEISDCCIIADCDEILYNLDCYELTPNVGDYESLGKQAAAIQFANLPPEVLAHLNYERLGKIKYADDSSAFVSGHRVIQTGQNCDEAHHAADPFQGYCLKLRLTSDSNPEGVWIKFPLYESDPVGDVERGEEIQVALAALKADSLDNCRAAECVCEYPSLNRCIETHAGVKLTDLVWKARNFTYAESELTQYGNKQANELKAEAENGELSKAYIKRVFDPGYYPAKVKPVKLSGEFLSQHFSEKQSAEEIEEIIAEALEMYYSNRKQ